MKKISTGVIILLAFLIACVTAQVVPQIASQVIAPPAKAGTNSVKWEYFCAREDSFNAKPFTDKLNAFGSKGWELVGAMSSAANPFSAPDGKTTQDSTVCFKRRLP